MLLGAHDSHVAWIWCLRGDRVLAQLMDLFFPTAREAQDAGICPQAQNRQVVSRWDLHPDMWLPSPKLPSLKSTSTRDVARA